MSKSILSEKNVIQSWLDTPQGYYIGLPKYGENLYELYFKNPNQVRLKLHRILDKIEEDLGVEISNSIHSIELLTVKESDNYFIGIFYGESQIAIGEVKL